MDVGPISSSGVAPELEQALVDAQTPDEFLLPVAAFAEAAMLAPGKSDQGAGSQRAIALVIIAHHARRVFSERPSRSEDVFRDDDHDGLRIYVEITQKDRFIDKLEKGLGVVFTVGVSSVLWRLSAQSVFVVLVSALGGIGLYCLYADMSAKSRFNRALVATVKARNGDERA